MIKKIAIINKVKINSELRDAKNLTNIKASYLKLK